MKKILQSIALGAAAAAAVIGAMGFVATRANAAYLPVQGGTGTAQIPTGGQVLIGTDSGVYTPAYLLCAGTCQVSTSSGLVTITGTGVATNTGNWAGTWQLYNPSDFLASSTTKVVSVNGLSGVVTITSSSLGVVWPTVNGNKATNYNITATNGVTSTVSGATTTISVSLNGGSAVTCSANQFLSQISAVGTAQCGSITFPTVPTYTTAAGSGISISTATSSSNTTTTVTLNINNGSVQTCTAGQDVNSITGLGIVSCNIAVHTIAGVNTSTISFVAAGGTSITTSTNSVTFTTVSTSTANTWTALQTFTQGVTANGQVTLASTTNALVVTNGSGQVTGYAGSTCSAGNAPTGISATGTVQSCTAYLTGNQSVTLTISGDATGTASGATAINDSITVSGLLGKALPSLATGTLEYTGGAWTLAPIGLSSYNVTGGTGISVATTTNSATVTNTGVTSFNTQTGAATYTVNAGTGLSVTTSTTSSTLTVNLNNGSLQSCTNQGVTGLTATGTIVCSADVFSIAGVSTGTISIVAGTNITISTTTNSITINSTGGGGGANNATGTIDETAVFNATNTLASNQPDYVPANFATAGCAGSSTATSINGCIQAIVAQEQALGASAATIIIPVNVGTSSFPLPINLNTNGFPVQLECTAGVRLTYGGTQQNASSGAIVFNFGNPSGHPALSEGAGCDLNGHTSWINAGVSNNATTTGIYFGGSNGAVGLNWVGNVNGFGINYVMGQNAYMDVFSGTSSGGNGGVITVTANTINGSTTITNVTNIGSIPLGSYLIGTGISTNPEAEVLSINAASSTLVVSAASNATGTTVSVAVTFGSLGQYDVAANSGERSLLSGTYTDPGNSSATDAVYIANGAQASFFCSDLSLDDAQFMAGFSNGLFSCNQIHVENSDYSQYHAYWPFWFASSQATMVSLTNIAVANDANNSGDTFPGIVKHGVNLYAAAIMISNYNSQTIATFADHSLNNGSESEEVCQIQTANGSGLTNIVSNQAYSQAAGATCTEDVANSWPVSIYNDSGNTAHIRNGGQDVGTFTSLGNWVLGSAANNSTITIDNNLAVATNETVGGTLNATGTITQAGVAVLTQANASGTANFVPIFTGPHTVGNSTISQSAGTTLINGTTPILDGAGDYIGPNIFMSTTSTASVGNFVQGGGVETFNASTSVTGAQFCAGGLINIQGTTGNITITLPTMATLASSTLTPCATSIWAGSFAQQYIVNNSTNTVVSATNGAGETQVYSPGTPSVLQPGQEWFVTGQFENSSTVSGAGAAGTTLVVKYLLEQTSTPLTVSGNVVQYNGVAVSTSTPASLAGPYLAVSGSSQLTVSSTLASSSWKFIISNATTTNNTTNIFRWKSDQQVNVSEFDCSDTVGTTTLFFFQPTTYTTTTPSSTILSAFACGTAGNTTTTNLTYGAANPFIVEVTSTLGTPITTVVHIGYTKQ